MKRFLMASLLGISSLSMNCDAGGSLKTHMTYEKRELFKKDAEKHFKKAYALLKDILESPDFDSQESFREDIAEHLYAFDFVLHGFSVGIVHSNMIEDLQFASFGEIHHSMCCLHTVYPEASKELQQCKYSLIQLEKEMRNQKKKAIKAVLSLKGYTQDSIQFLKNEIVSLAYDIDTQSLFWTCMDRGLYEDKFMRAMKFFELEWNGVKDPYHVECSTMDERLLTVGSKTPESFLLLGQILSPWLQTLPQQDVTRKKVEDFLEEALNKSTEIQNKLLIIEVLRDG